MIQPKKKTNIKILEAKTEYMFPRNQQNQLSQRLKKKLNKVHQQNNINQQHILAETRIFCSVCEEGIYNGKVIIIEGCKHGIHSHCLLPSLKVQLGEGKSQLSCPFEGCKNKNMSESFLRLVLTPQDLKRFYQFEVAVFIETKRRSGDWQPCPQPNCRQLFRKKSSQTTITGDLWYVCSTTNQKYCLKCNRKYHTRFVNCQQYERSLDPNSQQYKLMTFIKEAGLKQCPKCKRYVQKNQGCNHITCKCKFQFCYACQGPYPQCNCPNMVARREIRR